MQKRHFLIVLLFLSQFKGAPMVNGSTVLVAGWESDNVVQFNLATGKWSEVVHLPKGAHPRGITIGDKGEIFLGLQGGKKNIVELTLGKDPASVQDVTHSMGRFGPGIIAFGGGKIWAAGDADRTIFCVNPETGGISRPSQYKNDFNLVGLAMDGGTLYAAEYFQRSILRYDLKSGSTNATRFITHSPHLNRPLGMAIGHNGNLYVANGLEPTVVEFDIRTGEYVKTFVNLGAAGKDGINGLVYAPDVQRYYLASGSAIYEVDPEGKVIASYSSPALKKAYGIALISEPPSSQAIQAAADSQAPNSAFTAITTLKMTSPGHLQISGHSGERYQVMVTTDFKTWQPIVTLRNSNGTVEFDDPDAAKFDQRFYEIETLPEK